MNHPYFTPGHTLEAGGHQMGEDGVRQGWGETGESHITPHPNMAQVALTQIHPTPGVTVNAERK